MSFQVVIVDGTTDVVIHDTVAGVEAILEGNVGPPGPPGPPGSGQPAFVYVHPSTSPQAVWTIVHALNWDPAGIVVIDSDGYVRDGFGVQYLTAGQTLRLTFDIPLSGVARLS